MRLAKKIIIFGIIGVANTLLDLLILNILIEQLFFDYIIARSLSFICATIMSYVLNSTFTFKSSLSYRKYYTFLGITILGYLINVIGGGVILGILGDYLAYEYIVLVNVSALLATVISAVINFMLYSLLFKRDN